MTSSSPQGILALLERLPQTAAIVVSAVFEVLAWNDLAAALLDDFGALAPEDRNLARMAFLGPARRDAALYTVSDAAQFRHHVAVELRSALARYPSDPMVTALVRELRDSSREFSVLWERNDVQPGPTLRKTFRHPVVGEITVDCDSLTIPDCDQHLVLYTAPQGSPDADAMALLSRQFGAHGATAADLSVAFESERRSELLWAGAGPYSPAPAQSS